MYFLRTSTGPLLNNIWNRRSVLEDVPDFSVTTGLPHDIMRDLYKGVVLYKLKLLTNHCVNSGYFTIAELNDRISHFDFIADTPTPIDPALLRSGEHKLRQSASGDSPRD